ncbi:sulfite exporter TauE/SafE family protein [Microbulbifer sp. OS29]|uniref:Probable membrane transporter protein n=1 Tax=Microbulbifer okhotskensis TaxID=2926617 RepID=A0A9X2J7P9_9GAMM|nr:sulfite exporter TauE/SafE family protein [Microbulbifer okhotskensis]MCO1334726.1 sulfite exporter TauE/SafE family protein [Microbulbifer okhotskensis]
MVELLLLIFGALAWYISTLSAGGGAVLLLPVISFIVGPHLVAPTVTIAKCLASPYRALVFWSYIDWKVIRWLTPGSLIGAAAGAYTYTQMSPDWIQLIVGIFLISTVFQYQFGHREKTFPMTLPYFFPVGLVTSFVSGVVGAMGPLKNPFLLNYGVEKEALIATKALNSLLMQATKLVTYITFSAISLELALYGVAAGIGGIIGVFFAKRKLLKVSAEKFKIYTLFIMLICGLALVSKAMVDLI